MKRLLLLTGCIINIMLIGSCSSEKYNFDDLPRAVKSYFTITNTDLNINEAIVFKNESEDATTYLWDFGDGTTSLELNPSKVYTVPGMYTVKLKAIGEGGTGNYSQDIAVVDPNAVIETDKELYYIEYNNPVRAIRKISLKLGSISETVVSIAGKLGVGLAYDSETNKIYYTDFYDDSTPNGKIWRMNPDGTALQEIVNGISDPYSIVVDIKGKKIFWADDAGNISKANLDGTGLQRNFIHIEDGQMRGIAYNSKSDLIYFYEVNNEDLYVAKTDGTGVSKLIEGVYGYSIFVDEVNNKLYFEDRNEPAIMQSNLDGSEIKKLISVPSTRVYGLGIDYFENKLYWSDMNNGVIRRSKLDGTEVETFLSQLNSPRGLLIK